MDIETKEFEDIKLSPEDGQVVADIETVNNEVISGVSRSQHTIKHKFVLGFAITALLVIGLSIGLTQRSQQTTSEGEIALSNNLPRPVIVDSDYVRMSSSLLIYHT